MQVQVTANEASIIAKALRGGAYRSADEVIGKALQAFDSREKWRRRGIKVMLLFGTIVVAFAPLLFGKLHGRLHDHHISWISLIGGGEALLIASALIADGVGRTAALPGKIAWRVAVLVLGIGAILTGSYEYGSVATDRISQTEETKEVASALRKELFASGTAANSNLTMNSTSYVETQKLVNLILNSPYNEEALAQDSGVILLISFLIQFVALMLEED